MSLALTADKPAKFSLLQLALPSKAVENIGVLLFDPANDRLYKKLRSDWSALAASGEVEVLEALDRDFENKIAEMGGDEFLRRLEDTLSNTILISHRADVMVSNFKTALDRLFEEHVQRTEVIPFVTHVPLYSLRAAATKFGEDMDAAEEGWIEAPSRRKLDRNMFAARVVGRSMEPLIKDGSVCLFRAGVVGSRQNKKLLIQKMGTVDSGGEFTVKTYSSKKLPSNEDQWRHVSIRLQPMNPEFEAMEFGPDDEHKQFRVIAEFVRVIEEPA